MKAEITHDILFIVDRLSPGYGPIYRHEIHSLCYLSQLLSIYDGSPISEWGYSFINHETGGPFSAEINDEIDRLADSGCLDTSQGKDRFLLTEGGAEISSLTISLKYTHWRRKYLLSSIDIAYGIPLPEVINSIKREPLMTCSQEYKTHELLGDTQELSFLYEQFRAIKEVLGRNNTDVWIAGLLWVKYLNSTEVEEEV